MTTTTILRTAPGDRLPNGATLISRRRVAHDHEVVLARWGHEWVTWNVFHDDDRGTCHGHYHRDKDAAWRDYAARCVEFPSWRRV